MFAIYFKFSINYGMTPHSSELSEDEIPAKRVAIIITDGVRADLLYEVISIGETPFLQNIIESKGIYGISHTKAPTETNHCITALFSGHFDDGSITLKRLVNKSIILDSVFNQSRFSLGFGKEICALKIGEDLECIPYNKKNYLRRKYELGDYDLLNLNHNFFLNASKNKTLKTKLNQNKIIFAYHMNFTDAIGHVFGGTSNKLRNHLINLDSYFFQLEKDFYDFYKDNKTTFIITSDHGMINFSHGGSNTNLTRTPFIIWGAGIKKNEESKIDFDNFKYEISQIDIPALISGLLGINFPMNSLGVVPIDIMNISDKIKSKILFGNMMQIYEIYKVHNEKISKSILYKQYHPLLYSEKNIKHILNHINNKDYIEAISKTYDLINSIKKGIEYILHYDRVFLKTIIISGYILWILNLFILVEKKNKNILNVYDFYDLNFIKRTIISVILLLILFVYLYLRLSPLIYYILVFVTCYYLWTIILNIEYLQSFFIMKNDIIFTIKYIFTYIIAVLSFWSLVRIFFNFFYRH
jgi:phosphatidylinositol glycan class N